MSNREVPLRTLGDIAAVIRGTAPAKPTYQDAGRPFFGISEISAGGATPERFVAAEDVPRGAHHLARGDVAVALMSNIGASALITARHAGAVLGRECAALRPRTSDISGPWLYVWTQSADFQQQAERHVSGTTMPKLSLKSISDFTLPVPDLSTQLEVQVVLDDFDGAISKAGQVLTELTELRRIELELIITDLGADR